LHGRKGFSDDNQNIISEVWSVNRITVRDIINGRNSLYVPESCQHDFGSIDESYYYFRDICAKKKLDSRMINIEGKPSLVSGQRQMSRMLFGLRKSDKRLSKYFNMFCFLLSSKSV
jgi:hypothetical protein